MVGLVINAGGGGGTGCGDDDDDDDGNVEMVIDGDEMDVDVPSFGRTLCWLLISLSCC